MLVDEKKVKGCFPMGTPREGQIECCVEILQAFEDGKTDVVLDGPTGSGKSAIGMCVANYLMTYKDMEGFCTTPLKTLQDQYSRDNAFQNMFFAMKGKNSYECHLADGAHFCSGKPKPERDEIKASCRARNVCEYFNAIDVAKQSALVLNNTHALIYQSPPFSGIFDKRDFLIMDECHTAENVLMGLFSFTLNEDLFEKYELEVKWHSPGSGRSEKVIRSSNSFSAWISCISQGLSSYYSLNETEMDEKEEHALSTLIRNFDLYLEEPQNWVCDIGNKESFEFKPLYVSKYARYIKNKGTQHRLWMSATILDNVSFCKTLAIEDHHYIRLPSTFPPEASPIFMMEDYNIDPLVAANMQANYPRIARAVDDIVAKYPNEKGIIHTHTYKIAEYLENNCKHRFRFLPHGSRDREHVLKLFLESKQPLILVSPSMTEGIDLKDGLGRFQILCKMPYPYLGDAQIKARADEDPAWYQWKTVLAIVQASGRIIRHDQDWGKTYILDPKFKDVVKKNKNILPQYFLDRIVWV